jgi:hypothetical protein
VTHDYTASDWEPGIDPVHSELEEEPLTAAVFTAIGAASMCWTETPAGVFNDQEAARIAYGLIRWIEMFYEANGGVRL